MKTVRQGDLLFIPVENTREVNPTDKQPDGIIREGEATGHHHRLAILEDAEVFRPSSWGDTIVRVSDRGVSIVHEEHHTVTLAPNTTYKVHVAREFDYLRASNRFVAD